MILQVATEPFICCDQRQIILNQDLEMWCKSLYVCLTIYNQTYNKAPCIWFLLTSKNKYETSYEGLSYDYNSKNRVSSISVEYMHIIAHKNKDKADFLLTVKMLDITNLIHKAAIQKFHLSVWNASDIHFKGSTMKANRKICDCYLTIILSHVAIFLK
jgi:hypothetical protein